VKKIPITILLLLFGKFLLAQVAIIPKPIYFSYQNGADFEFNNQTKVIVSGHNDSLKAIIQLFQEEFESLTGYALKKGKAKQNFIKVHIAPNLVKGNDAYELLVNVHHISISAASAKGIFYAFQSLKQLMPPVRSNAPIKIPAMSIYDASRFSWRGMHLDVSRHFSTVSQVKSYINLMAMYKMNTFHWHLTDDQGWRIEIKKYPLLTQIGGFRVDRRGYNFNDRPAALANEIPTYGGYYTQEEIKEIVAYAAARQIQVVPEIEMPGHSAAAIAAYPQFCCTKKAQLPMVGGDYATASSNFCAGNDSSFIFLKDVLSEVIELFPSAYLHIGGDEVDKKPWKACSACQLRMKNNKLSNEEELQSWFIKQIGNFLKAKNKLMVGWDEILEGGLAPNAVVMSWRGEQGGIDAAKMGHQVIMTPGVPCYFDHYQGDPETEPKAFGGFNPLKKVYDYEPVPADLGDSLKHLVLGAQGNVWTEYMTGFNQVEYMILPRMPAMAEVLWSDPAQRNWEDFSKRVETHMLHWERQGYQFSKGNTKVTITPIMVNNLLKVGLSSDILNTEIRYTTNGEKPGLQSKLYTDTILVDTSMLVQAILVRNNQVLSLLPAQQAFVKHKAIGAKIKYVQAPSNRYTAEGESTLVNGIKGNLTTRPNWIGMLGKDLSFTAELSEIKTASSIGISFLHYYRAWVFAPLTVSFSVSKDGINWSEPINVSNDLAPNTNGQFTKTFSCAIKKQDIKFIKVTAKNMGVCPQGHAGEGEAAWLFADELVVE
jgi:hexosaminidase